MFGSPFLAHAVHVRREVCLNHLRANSWGEGNGQLKLLLWLLRLLREQAKQLRNPCAYHVGLLVCE